MGRTNRRRDRWLKRGLETMLRPVLSRAHRPLSEIQATRPRRVLIVRQHNQMGDMLCATPAMEAVVATFPHAETMLVTAPVNDGVVRNHPAVHSILVFDKRELRTSIRRVWRFCRTLRAFGPDVAVVLNSVSFSSTSAWIAKLSGARFLIGGSSVPFGWSFSRWLYDLEMPTSRELNGHAIDHGLRGLAAVGFETPTRQPLIRTGLRAKVFAREFLAEVGEAPRFAIHPGAAKEPNRWPAERFAGVVEAMRRQGASVYLIEGPADIEAVAQVQSHLSAECSVLRGVDVATVAATLAESDLALVNDTGIMHIAGAMGVPTVALFGPTPREEWAPPSPQLKALQAHDGRIESLDEELVFAELLAALAPSEAL
jgi:ADP-heptose:LPS heptosyltransferase